MDEPLTLHPVAGARRRIADAWLAQPVLDGRLGEITLAAHQLDAAGRIIVLLRHSRAALLADEPGMGKTFVALAVARSFASFAVVAPAGLRAMWQDAFARTGVAGPWCSFERLSRGTSPEMGTVELMVVDEAHHVRNHATRRYRELASALRGARVLLLSATPVHNRATDLRNALALALGPRARSLGRDVLRRLVVRRSHHDVEGGRSLPEVATPIWRPLSPQPPILRAIARLPPAVALADGGEAHALLRLGLIRAWTSSDAALRGVLRRRLERAAALTAAIEGGRMPTGRELSAWAAQDGVVQLAFPELVIAPSAPQVNTGLVAAIATHANAVRGLLGELAQTTADEERAQHLREVQRAHSDGVAVAFSQFADTVKGLYALMSRDAGVATVTASGARIASGRVPRNELVEMLGGMNAPRNSAMPLRLVLSTDVLSEGLNLRAANVLIHLDLPWTMARIEQRLGRIRRLDSARRVVHVYAIGPPATARALAPILRSLRRKIRIVAGEVGDASGSPALVVPGRTALAATLRPGMALDPLERLRRIVGAWTDTAGPLTATPCPVISVGVARAVGADWTALAAVRIAGCVRLVSLAPSGVTDATLAVLDAVDSTRSAQDCVPEALSRAPSAIEEARNLLDSWMEERRAEAHVDVMAAPLRGRAVALALRCLQALARASGRHERSRLVSLAASCRQALVGASGMAGEMAAADWLRELRIADDRTPAARFARLLDLLRPASSNAGPASGADSVLALLVVCNNDDGAALETAPSPGHHGDRR